MAVTMSLPADWSLRDSSELSCDIVHFVLSTFGLGLKASVVLLPVVVSVSGARSWMGVAYTGRASRSGRYASCINFCVML